MTGGAAAILDAGGFGLLSHWGMAAYLAASISFIAAVILNYQLSSRFVFDKQPTANQFVKFLLIASLGLLVNVGITIWVMQAWDIMPILAKVIAIGLTFILNFMLNNYLVFTK